jgi:hypothetical protein
MRNISRTNAGDAEPIEEDVGIRNRLPERFRRTSHKGSRFWPQLLQHRRLRHVRLT